MWEDLEGSPPLRAQTPSIASSMISERRLDIDMQDFNTNNDSSDAPAVIESFIHLDELRNEPFVYAYFSLSKNQSIVKTPGGDVVSSSSPCRPRLVKASRIFWSPILGNDGLSGHKFSFLNEHEISGHIEVFVSSHEVTRIAIIHRLFTPFAVKSGIVDPQAIIEFTTPAGHYQRLLSFLETLPATQFYLPTNEVVVGQQIDLPVEIDPRYLDNPASVHAHAVWRETKVLLRRISDVAFRSSEIHNQSELHRAGLI